MQKTRCKIGKKDPQGGGIYEYIQNLKFLDCISFCSRVILLIFTTLIFFPPALNLMDATAAPTPSTTSLTLSTSDIVAEITPNSGNGTFQASDPATISITTNNYSGYTLGISSNDNIDNTKLINTDDNSAYLTSISSASSVNEFNINNWGYLPSKLNSQANTAYQPAPTTTATILETTNVANVNANEYTITLGAKADYTLPSGVYENTFNITAVANPVAYSITYNKNTTDTVTNMPSTQSGAIDEADITISNTIPTRAHYTFQGWCNVTPTTDNGVDSCSGTTYQPGDVISMNKTTANNTTLYALWKIDTFTQTTQVRYEVANADGTYGSYTIVDTKDVKYGDTYSWSTSQISGFDTATYNSASVTAYTITEAKTNSVNITRKSYTLTINRNTSYISSVSGGGTYKVGKAVSISATAATYYKFASWSQTAGTAGSFGSTTSASTTFTMPASAATIYANGSGNPAYMQFFTKTLCASQASSGNVTKTDIRDGNTYTVRYINGNCWMTQNLRLAKGTTLSSTWSNVSSSYTIPQTDLNTGGSYTAGQSHNSGNTTYGYWYNYCAASAGTVCNNTQKKNASYDLCPAGWRLPTSTEAGTVVNYKTAFSPVAGGYWYYVGDLRSDTYGYWWTATAYDAGGQYYLNFVDSKNLAIASNSYGKYYGHYIRCIAK